MLIIQDFESKCWDWLIWTLLFFIAEKKKKFDENACGHWLSRVGADAGMLVAVWGHCTSSNGDVVVVKMFIVVTFCIWFWKSVSGGFGDGDGSKLCQMNKFCFWGNNSYSILVCDKRKYVSPCFVMLRYQGAFPYTYLYCLCFHVKASKMLC